MIVRALMAGLCLAMAALAHAQLRTIPAEAKRGEIRHLQDNQVEINGAPMRLSPGAQIRDADNRIVVPASLTPGVLVRYLLDGQGNVFRAWILSPQEAAQPEPKN